MEIIGGNVCAVLHDLGIFAEAIEARKSAEVDPKWHVFTYLTARFSGGARELLQGVPVDPKSNPCHRHATQYLADLGLLTKWRGSLVTAVGYFSTEQGAVNKSMTASTTIDRFVFISLHDYTRFEDKRANLVPLKRGDVLVVTQPEELPTCETGFGVLVVMGYPDYRGRGAVEPLKATVILTSRDMNIRATTNRPVPEKPNTYQGQIACPDCRRPIRMEISDTIEGAIEPAGEPDLLVTVVTDKEEADQAIQMGLRVGRRFPNRFIVTTDTELITDDVKAVWPATASATPLLRWMKRRGMHDYAVPEGFVSPILFPKGESVKDSFYSLVQAIGITELAGKRIWLVDPEGDHGVDVIPSRPMHRQMVAELRDWTHPCHKWRESPIAFILEWTKAYNEPRRFGSPTGEPALAVS